MLLLLLFAANYGVVVDDNVVRDDIVIDNWDVDVDVVVGVVDVVDVVVDVSE